MTTRAKRASYRHAVEWVAGNDSPGEDDALDVEWVSRLVTVCLVADLFGKPDEEVGADVVRFRVKHGLHPKGLSPPVRTSTEEKA